MKKYINPQLEIVFFAKEEVATTASVATMNAFDTWATTVNNGNKIDKRMVDFEQVLAFTF